MRVTRSGPPHAEVPSGADSPPTPGGSSRAPSDTVSGAGSVGEPGAAGTAAVVPLEIKVVVVGAVLAGLVLRFVAPSPLWLDEALSVNIAKLPVGDIFEALRHDGHPPLYYLMLHGWMRVAGAGDEAVRALSGIVSVASLPFAYLVGRRRGGPLLGWILLGVFALEPFVLRYATETRMYSVVTLLVLVGYLLLDDITRLGRDGWGRVAALAVVAAGLLYSHYWTMWLIATVGVVLAVAWRRAQPGESRRATTRAVIALAAGGVLFLPWVPTLLYQSRHTGTPWSGPLRPGSVLGSTLTDFGGGNFKDAQFVGAVLLVLLLLGVFGRAIDSSRIEIDLRTVPQLRVEAAVLAGTILLGLAVSYGTWSAFVTRYASAFLVLALLLVAGGVTRFTQRWVRSGVFILLLALLSFGCVYNLTKDRTQAGPVVARINELARPGDVVVYCPDQLGPATMRLLPEGLRQVGYPTLTSPERIDWVDYVQRNDAVAPADYASQVVDFAGPDHAVFVVWSGGYKTHQGTCEAMLGQLSAERPVQQTLVSEDGDTYFEHANLVYFPGA